MQDNVTLFIWIVLTVIFAVIEAATVQLVTVWFAVGSFAALLVYLFGVKSIAVQIAVFLLVSVIALLVTRPFIKKVLHKQIQPTNADRIIGQTGIVTEKIDNENFTGAISINGSVWTARSKTGESIEPGEKIKILCIEGVKVIVEKIY